LLFQRAADIDVAILVSPVNEASIVRGSSCTLQVPITFLNPFSCSAAVQHALLLAPVSPPTILMLVVFICMLFSNYSLRGFTVVLICIWCSSPLKGPRPDGTRPFGWAGISSTDWTRHQRSRVLRPFHGLHPGPLDPPLRGPVDVPSNTRYIYAAIQARRPVLSRSPTHRPCASNAHSPGPARPRRVRLSGLVQRHRVRVRSTPLAKSTAPWPVTQRSLGPCTCQRCQDARHCRS
jgi:hypothetical protein